MPPMPRLRLRLLLPPLLVLVLFFLGQSTAAQRNIFPCFGGQFQRPIVLAHRGSRHLSAENTMRAFHTVLQIGIDVLEMDVRLTRDRKLIVFHDSTLDRTTNRGGDRRTISQMTLEELRQDEFLDPAFHFGKDRGYPLRDKFRSAHERIAIPLFEEVLEELWGAPAEALHDRLQIYRDVYINVEIKDNNKVAADELLAILLKWDRRHVRKRIVVSSRWCDVMKYFRDISRAHRIPTGACESEATQLFLAAMLRGAVQALVPFAEWKHFLDQNIVSRLESANDQNHPCVYQLPTLSSGLTVMREEVVQLAHTLGSQVQFWVINNVTTMHRAIELGADGVITDRPDLAKSVLNEVVGVDLLPPRDGYNHHRFELGTLPAHSMEEVHTCVTWKCVVLQNVGSMGTRTLATFLFGLFFSFHIFLFLCCCRWCCRTNKPTTKEKQD